MSLAGQEIKWCDQVKYLGIYLAQGRALKFDVNPLKRSFFMLLANQYFCTVME